MEFNEAFHWLLQGELRQHIILSLSQPLTALQIAFKCNSTQHRVSDEIRDLRVYELVECLNPDARRSRLYWTTTLGFRCRASVAEIKGIALETISLPGTEWELYGELLFNHRATVLRVLDGPMQPSQIKRRARFLNPRVRMSANNARDVVKFFERMGVVRRLYLKGKRHARFELTEMGRKFQDLLRRAESRP